MARKLTHFDWSTHSGGGRSRYPWHEWLDGSTIEVVEGEDIHRISSFRPALAHAARKYNRAYKTMSFEGTDGKRRLVFTTNRLDTEKADA